MGDETDLPDLPTEKRGKTSERVPTPAPEPKPE